MGCNALAPLTSLSGFTGVPIGSGGLGVSTAALEMAGILAKLGPGDEVIVLAMVESERAIQTILVGDAPPGAPAPTVS